MLRLNGELHPIRFRDLGDTELQGYVDEILTENQRDRFDLGGDLDFAYISEDGGRFRVNIDRKDTGVGATFRHIPDEVIPALGKEGVSEQQIRVLTVENPRRLFEQQRAY